MLTAAPTGTPHILIVDDKPENLYALEKILAPLGARVVRATSGNDALALALEHDFCVAIVDVQMPEMDGYELVELLRGNHSTATLPIIFVSAIFSDEYHHRKGYDAGAVDFLSKPFVPEILVSKVRVFIELHERRAQLQVWNQHLEQVVAERTEALRVAYETLEKLDRAKTDFIAIAAHELRTPLTIIQGYANMLLEMVDALPGGRDMVQGILTGQERLLEVVNSMLDISRLDNQTLQTCKEPTSLDDTIRSIRAAFDDALQKRALQFEIVSLETLPVLEADPELLRKLFYNLIVNAIKYTPNGGKITVGGEAVLDNGRDCVHVWVRDTGIGIDSAHQALIFEKFYQTGKVEFHSSSKTGFKGGGPGLGLAIARGIVNLHGGRIWAESPGHDEKTLPGSTFHVVLPCDL